jgi:hypothetical protein
VASIEDNSIFCALRLGQALVAPCLVKSVHVKDSFGKEGEKEIIDEVNQRN